MLTVRFQIERRVFEFQVPDLRAARDAWERERDAAAVGASGCRWPAVFAEDGGLLAEISYNGRVWEPGGYKREVFV